MKTRLLVFDTTHHALWAEQVAQQHALAAEVVPAPAEAQAKCDLALAVLEEDADALSAALTDEGVPFRLWLSGS